MKLILTEPIAAEDIAPLKTGDIFYYTGRVATGRDAVHQRFLSGEALPVSLKGGALLHAGPIVAKAGDGYNVVAIGPTTSMRMEQFESSFIASTGVRLIIGKGGMGAETAAACARHKAVHCVFPAGCAVLAAQMVQEIERVEWLDLGMPECIWVCRVKEFGPLIVSIDADGNNLFEDNKRLYHERTKAALAGIRAKAEFMV